MYKKRRRSSWPSRLLVAGLVLGGSLVATSVFANCEGASEPITIAPGETKSCKIETGSDEDGFQFDAQSGYTYTISATGVDKDIDIALGLQCGDTKMQANRGFDGEDEVLDNYTAPVTDSPVTCSLRVFLTGFFGWTNTGYQLNVTGKAPTVKPQLEIKLTPEEVKQPLQVTAGTDSQPIVFQVTDKNNKGQAVLGQTIQFSLLNNSDNTKASEGTFKTTPDPATTLADGQISLVLTAPTKAGDYKIKAEIPSSTATSVEVTVTVNPDAPAKLKLTENGCETSPSVGTSCTMTFDLMDNHDNKIVLTGKTVSFTVTSSDISSKVKDCVVSLENGQVKCTLTPDKAGSYTIASATVDGQTKSFDPATLPVVVVKVATSTFALTAKDNLPPTATVKSSYTVTFILTENGTPKGGESVHFEMTPKPSGSNASLTPATDQPTVESGNIGEVSVSFTPDIEGQYVITASLVSDSKVTGKAEVTATKAAEVSKPTLDITNTCPNPLSQGTTCSFTFTLKGGDTSSAKTIQVKWTKPDGSTENLPDVQIQVGKDSNKADLTFGAKDNYTITAVLATDSTVTGSTSVAVSSASPPPQTPTLNISPCQSPSVGIPCSFTVTLTDGDTSKVNTIQVSRTKSGGSTENLPDVTMAAGANSGSTDLTFDSEGNYTITAVLAEDQSVKGELTLKVDAITPPSPTPGALKLIDENDQEITVEMVTNIDSKLLLTFQLLDNGQTPTGIKGKSILLACSKSGNDCNALLEPANATTGIDTGENGKVAVVFKTDDKVGTYTIKASLNKTDASDPDLSKEVTVKVVSLTVTEGGNQSIYPDSQKPSAPITSKSIVFQLKDEKGANWQNQKIVMALQNASSPEEQLDTAPNIVDVKGSVIAPTKEKPQEFLDQTGKPCSPDDKGCKGVVVKVHGQTDEEGTVKVEIPFDKKVVKGVTTYGLSASLEANPGVADYTNVFLLEKQLDDKLLKTWPTLGTMDENGTATTGGDGKGVAVNVKDEEVNEVNNATFFHGGLSLKDKNEFLQKPANKVKLAKDKDGKPIKEGKDKSDLVMVQGVIQVDPAHVNQPAEIVVFGENDSPTASDAADGCYMLGSSAMIDLQTLGGKEVCQRFREKKMTAEDMTKLIPFKRGVTLTDKVLVEMYTGTFYYGADSLRIYFGYRLADGTLVYNGSNPIYITIEEKPADTSDLSTPPAETSPASEATGGKEATDTGDQPSGGTSTSTTSTDTTTTTPSAPESPENQGSEGTTEKTSTVPKP